VEVWVPKSARRTNLLATMLPRRLAEGVARAMRADRVLADADAVRRREYELRASRSEPALAGADQPALAPAGTEAPQAAPEPGAGTPAGAGTPDGGIG
jgi:hypothetical protein